MHAALNIELQLGIRGHEELLTCTKAEAETGAVRRLQQDAGKSSWPECLMSNLELRLGISTDNGAGCGGGGGDPWLGVGVHPWSLAARQAEKVALEEQDHQRPPQQPVGWPPVCAFRRSHLQAGAKAVEEPTSKVKSGEQSPATMFVKVNMEGCAVGRKVDLQAHRGYASLSRVLKAMFHGFLSEGQWRIAGRGDDDGDEQSEPTKSNKKAYILLYEDNEGDRMLVGDVPWELFIASVKRLYIAQDPRKTKN